MTFRKKASALLIASIGIFGGLQYIKAQINPFVPVVQRQQELQVQNFYDTHEVIELKPSPLEMVILGYHEGVLLAKGSFDVTRNRHTEHEVRVTSEMPNSDLANGTLDVVIQVMENYPPYMLREQCNIQAIYITSNIYRNDERANGIAFSEGILLISEQDIPTHPGYSTAIKVTHHEIGHGCIHGREPEREKFYTSWNQIAIDHGTPIEYIGDDWKELDHASIYPGVARSYSLSNPAEAFATMWEEIMTNNNTAHKRADADALYLKYMYEVMYYMLKWSGGLMDLEVFELLARNDKVDRDYYERTFGDRAFMFRPAEKE